MKIESNFIFLIASLLLLLGTAGELAAQYNELKLEKIRNGKIIDIPADQEISLKLRNGDEIKGKFESATDSSLTIAGTEISFNQIAQIIMLKKGSTFLKVMGAVVVLIGIAYAGFSILVWISGLNFNDPIFVIGGIVDAVIGTSLVGAGLLPYFGINKKFKIGKKWQIVSEGQDYYTPR